MWGVMDIVNNLDVVKRSREVDGSHNMSDVASKVRMRTEYIELATMNNYVEGSRGIVAAKPVDTDFAAGI
jgi:hypothetical protein